MENGEGFMMAAGRCAMIVAVTAAVFPLVFAGAGQAAAGTRVPAVAGATALGGTWHAAIEVPGTAALNKGGNAAISSVSCASAANCSAGGVYTRRSGHEEAGRGAGRERGWGSGGAGSL